MGCHHRRLALWFLVVLYLGVFRLSAAWAVCAVETESNNSEAMVLHLSRTCTDHERTAHTVHAEEILAAIQQGKKIDLVGVLIEGDLLLDQLPLIEVKTLDHLPPAVEQLLASENVTSLRLVRRGLSIRHARIRGMIATKLKQGYLLMLEPVTMTGTAFERTVDFSRAMLTASVDWSHAVFLREALFVQGQYYAPARFDYALFDGHARFHLAHFREDAAFANVRFNDLAEFLEVTFEKKATFSEALFKMGMGFSGSRFEGEADFSQSVFGREAYFLFTHAARMISFQGAEFRGVADFSDAAFNGRSDFSRVDFAVAPLFQRATIQLPVQETPGPRAFYALAVVFAALTGLLIWVTRRRSAA